jgi:hypothetical protein
MRTLILLPLTALLACAGTKTEQGISGTSGEDGASGEEGPIAHRTGKAIVHGPSHHFGAHGP